MDILIILVLIFLTMLFSVYKGITIVYPLSMGLIVLMLHFMRKGYSLSSLLGMIFRGTKKSLLIIQIFVLIGAITAIWRASGTVSFIVYYGIKLMNPDFFILSSFVLSCIVSFLLGTAFGTTGTIGIVLMVMAKSGNVNVNLLAGAVIAGAYFGDRCSPMSSSANLVATITGTELYRNIRNMLITSIAPLTLAVIFYTLLSFSNPLTVSDNSISMEIKKHFNIDFVVIVPALVILVLAALRVNVKISMAASVLSGIVIAIAYQNQSFADIIRYIIVGYSGGSDSFFMDIIKGGGLLSMLRVSLIVLLSFAYSGLFEETQVLKNSEAFVLRLRRRFGVFITALLISIASASFGCTQALSIMLTNQLASSMYEKEGKNKSELALDLEDTSVVISPLIPWNIGGAVPAATLAVGLGFIPYAFYLYMIPVTSYMIKKLKIRW
ncbi:MAG: Na+/H+ antiporter NhaC family protein [Bacillota bacterium]